MVQAADMAILIIDDHGLTREMVRSILRQSGYSTLFLAESGQEALEIMKNNEIQLVVCDWNMPGMSGLEVLRTIRSDRALKRIPFVMLTAEAYKENIVEALRSGVTEYVVKPFTAQTLTEKVAAALQTVSKE